MSDMKLNELLGRINMRRHYKITLDLTGVQLLLLMSCCGGRLYHNREERAVLDKVRAEFKKAGNDEV